MLRTSSCRVTEKLGQTLFCCLLSVILAPSVIAQSVSNNAVSNNAVSNHEFDCVIEPHMVVDLSSRVDGIVENIWVERGELVEAGQPLVDLDSGVEEAVVEHSRARARASAELSAGSVSLDFATRRKARVEALFKTAAVSPDQMDEVSTEANLALLQLQRAEENKRLAELQLRQSMEILDRHTIRSPISGVVVARYLAPGESVKDVPILRIAQVDPLRVEVIVPVSEFGTIEAGQSAIVHPEAPMQGNYAAKVTIVDRVADAASGTFRVRLNLPNPDYVLPSGLKCGVRFLPVEPPKARQVNAHAQPDQAQPVPQNQAQPAAQIAPPTETTPRLTAVATAVATQEQCQTVGPIDKKPQAVSLMKTLGTHSDAIQMRETRDKKTESYMVLSPDQGSLEQAKAYAETVKAAGIKDLYAVPKGEHVGQVALGYYYDKVEAEKRQALLATAGFDTELSVRTKEQSAFWIDLETNDVSAVAALPALEGMGVETVSCESTLTARD
jgi:RND family efflux transporter MFP subunit